MSSSCRFCSKLLKSERGLRNHVFKMHNDKYAELESLTFQCAKCIMSFYSASALSAHKKSHAKDIQATILSKDEEIAALKEKLNQYEKNEKLESKVAEILDELTEYRTELDKERSRFQKLARNQFYIPIFSDTHQSLIDVFKLQHFCKLEFNAFPSLAEFIFFNDDFPERQTINCIEKDGKIFVEIYDCDIRGIKEEGGYELSEKLLDFLCEIFRSHLVKHADVLAKDVYDLSNVEFDYWCMYKRIRDIKRSECKDVQIRKIMKELLILSQRKRARMAKTG